MQALQRLSVWTALSLWQPWAGLVVLGEKEWETRSWPTRFRGLFMVHAALQEAPKGDRIWNAPAEISGVLLSRGAIVGVGMVGACVRTEHLAGKLTTRQCIFGDFSPGRYGWRIDDPVALDVPVPCAGRQRLWRVPPLVVAEVRSRFAQQLAALKCAGRY